ncbi:gliding motility-associated C-terminal domain-containing protein [Flammeovirgaceae bacterium SG7u.111]|nr:gliding motility-associated C-terminal domain-containing protein [Flammeovirgaceae bacterium SG7u.132]WPO37379.1 gliding motility-associated C-terminal domain-containing protein [Flammeovirgaceae bacterium SG7u.111]
MKTILNVHTIQSIIKPASFFSLFFMLTFFWAEVKGQGDQACFSLVDFNKGCAALTVTISDCSGANPANVTYNYGEDPNEFTSDITHTYTVPGVYTITQYVSIGDDRPTKTLTVPVYEPISPKFEVAVCEGRKVSVQLPDDEDYTVYTIDFGDGSMEVTANAGEEVEYTYADLNLKNITVTGGFVQGGGTCGSAGFPVTPVDNIQTPSISQVSVLPSGNIRLDFNLPQNIPYVLEEALGNTAFNEIESLSGFQNSIELPNRESDNFSYCYRIKAVDGCTGGEVFSNVVCSMSLTALADNGQNLANWREYPIVNAFQSYKLVRTNGSNVSEVDFNDITTTVYIDTDVTCNVEYCYQIEANIAPNVKSISQSKCVTALTDEPPVAATDVMASVEGESVVISWENPSGATITKLRKTDSDGNQRDYLAGGTDILDDSVDVNTTVYCYVVTFEDQCGNSSPESAEACTILTSGQKSGEDNEISWTPFAGMQEGFTYTIEVLDERGQVIRTIDGIDSSTNSYIDPAEDLANPIAYYRVVAISATDPRVRSNSNIAVVVELAQLDVPTAFSPNGDNLNDTFYPRGKALVEFRMKIFNRWGEQVFEGTNPQEGWDGTYLGRVLEAGPYTYQIEAMDYNGNQLNAAGIVTLVK